MRNKTKFKNFILDADGVFTDGSFYYSKEGKLMKKYGPDDADALAILKNYLKIIVISGDKRGYRITEKRIVQDMGLKLFKVSTFQRLEWILKHFNLEETIYMGDGIFDSLVFNRVAYSIAPANSLDITKKKANFVTKRKGGEGAVAEAAIHIMTSFFNVKFDENLFSEIKESGAWKKNEKK